MSAEWTPAMEEQLRRMRAEGLTLWQISQRMGLHPSSVQRRVKWLELGKVVRPPKNPPLTAEQKAQIAAMVEDGELTVKQMAAAVGCQWWQASDYAARLRRERGVARMPPAKNRLASEPAHPYLADVPQISDRLALKWDHALTHEDRVEISQTIAAATAKLREHYRRQPFRAMQA